MLKTQLVPINLLSHFPCPFLALICSRAMATMTCGRQIIPRTVWCIPANSGRFSGSRSDLTQPGFCRAQNRCQATR
jgi:hypothetical protein